MGIRLSSFALLMAALSAGTPLVLGAPQEKDFSFKDAYALLEKHCEVCHNGNAPEERPVSQFNVRRVEEPSSLVEEAPLWKRVLIKVREEEMPPVGRPAPTKEDRAALVKWLEESLKPAKVAARVVPPFAGKGGGQLQGGRGGGVQDRMSFENRICLNLQRQTPVTGGGTCSKTLPARTKS